MLNHAPFSGVNAKAALALGLFLCLCVSFQQNAHAQGNFGRVEDTETNVDAYFYFVEKGSATIQVSAFGKLYFPGVYVLEEGVNLAFMLALTGGPTSTNQPDVSETRTVRLFRNTGNGRSLAFEATFDDVMDQASDSPVLTEGDIVVLDVQQKRKLNWRDLFTVIGPILSTLLLIERLTSNN